MIRILIAAMTLLCAAAYAQPSGALNPDVTQATIGATICVPNWTATVRPSAAESRAIKRRLMRAQGIPPKHAGLYELDHLVPLAIGGHPRDPSNLWLQAWGGKWGAHRKDRLEVRLKRLVCTSHLTLQQAQEAIGADWRAAYLTYVGAP